MQAPDQTLSEYLTERHAKLQAEADRLGQRIEAHQKNIDELIELQKEHDRKQS